MCGLRILIQELRSIITCISTLGLYSLSYFADSSRQYIRAIYTPLFPTFIYSKNICSKTYIVGYPHRTYGSSNSNWYVKFQMFMSARAFWWISYFAVFFTEYLNFSWYNLMEAYIFSISIKKIIDNQLLQCIYRFIPLLGAKNNTSKYRRANVI